jgi:hypothetical protein
MRNGTVLGWLLLPHALLILHNSHPLLSHPLDQKWRIQPIGITKNCTNNEQHILNLARSIRQNSCYALSSPSSFFP